jgi:hypothetical protein
MKSPGYDSLKDLQGVALVGDSPLVLAVPAAHHGNRWTT